MERLNDMKINKPKTYCEWRISIYMNSINYDELVDKIKYVQINNTNNNFIDFVSTIRDLEQLSIRIGYNDWMYNEFTI